MKTIEEIAAAILELFALGLFIIFIIGIAAYHEGMLQ